MIAKPEIDEVLAQYKDGALGTSDRDPRKANKAQARMHAAYKSLRETVEGREAILSLLDDPSPHVRCWAAAHSLEWNEVAAVTVLEGLRESRGPCSFDAEMTLAEFRKGQLSFNY
jgi:hypothetical protein